VLEMLVATAIMMAVTGAVFGLMDPAQGFFAAQPELSDMQQRVRVGVETLQRDLMMAGAGTYSGTKVGTLGPYRGRLGLAWVIAPLVAGVVIVVAGYLALFR